MREMQPVLENVQQRHHCQEIFNKIFLLHPPGNFLSSHILKWQTICLLIKNSKCILEIKLSCVEIDGSSTVHYLKPGSLESLTFDLHRKFLFWDFAARKKIFF
jgi:hypothetical protein